MAYPCECSLPPALHTAGAAVSLCHHSSGPDARQAVTQLAQVLQQWPGAPDAETLLNVPIKRLLQRYIDQVVGPDQAPLLTQPERDAITVAFLRQCALQCQLIMAGVIAAIDNPAPSDSKPDG